ncbi:MAG: hypothetical protein WA269_14790, partial [Candidatus Udaeobacter sp.]
MKNRSVSSARRAKILARGLLICFLPTGTCLNAAQLEGARVTQVVKDVKLCLPQAAPHRVAVGESFRDD